MLKDNLLALLSFQIQATDRSWRSFTVKYRSWKTQLFTNHINQSLYIFFFLCFCKFTCNSYSPRVELGVCDLFIHSGCCGRNPMDFHEVKPVQLPPRERRRTCYCYMYLVKIQSTQRPNFKSNKFQTPHLSSTKQEIKLTEDRPWYRTNNLILPVAMGAKTSNLEKLKKYIYSYIFFR